MRWKAKPIPKVGDFRERFPFAWLPTEVGEYTVWLERYWVKEELTHVAVLDEGVVYPVERWVERERNTAMYYY